MHVSSLGSLPPLPHSEWNNAAFFSTSFEIHADLSAATNDLVQRTKASGEVYYQLNYYLIVYFGLAEIKAELAWKTKVRVKPYVLQFSDLIFISRMAANVGESTIVCLCCTE